MPSAHRSWLVPPTLPASHDTSTAAEPPAAAHAASVPRTSTSSPLHVWDPCPSHLTETFGAPAPAWSAWTLMPSHSSCGAEPTDFSHWYMPLVSPVHSTEHKPAPAGHVMSDHLASPIPWVCVLDWPVYCLQVPPMVLATNDRVAACSPRTFIHRHVSVPLYSVKRFWWGFCLCSHRIEQALPSPHVTSIESHALFPSHTTDVVVPGAHL